MSVNCKACKDIEVHGQNGGYTDMTAMQDEHYRLKALRRKHQNRTSRLEQDQ